MCKQANTFCSFVSNICGTVNILHVPHLDLLSNFAIKTNIYLFGIFLTEGEKVGVGKGKNKTKQKPETEKYSLNYFQNWTI